MEKFKGKFQEACCTNRNLGPGSYKMFEEYDFAWEYYLHCSCHICDLKRQEEGVSRCIDKSCDGCKNKAAGKKVRCWIEDTMKGK
jgi:hypothetical protein